jgi:hypothetical protein
VQNFCGMSRAADEVMFAVTAAPDTGPHLPNVWPGGLPPRTFDSHPVCRVELPANAQCVNDLIGPPEAICVNRTYSCTWGPATCAKQLGLWCWAH